ncbi:MAG: tripartite tricarboxylate transporter substrate binding protein [Hyphomicrobiales bacterium]|nr:tripartite tricarboxylate transporter substrate binding protein [Hyphomicrobiales bacterium]
MQRTWWISMVAAASLALATDVGAAEAFPSKTVKLVVPSAAGSVPDTVARMLASRLGEHWRQPVIVENMAGAGLNIGASYVARMPADGYTLMVTPPPPVTVNNFLYRGLSYRTDAFVPITMLVQVPNALIVRPDFPAKNLQEFIARVKAAPGKITFGSQGLGSTAYLTTRLFESLTATSMNHVPYRGELPILTDIVAGHLDVFFGTMSTALPMYKSGKLRFLAAASATRSRLAPEVPTIDESGLAGFQSTAWFALVGPPGLPDELVGRLNRDIAAIMGEKDVAARLRDMQLESIVGSPQDAKAFIARETKLWTGVIKDAGVPMQ